MMYSIHEAEEKILEACRLLVEKGLIARTWGNVSARISDTEFLITPSGRAYEEITAADLVRVGIKDLSWEGDVKPSSEKEMHARIYRIRESCGFIIHTHQTNASALSVTGERNEFRALAAQIASEEERSLLGNVIPCASYGLSSTRRLAKNVARTVQENPGSRAVLMRYHGAVIMGEDDETAFRAADALETVCGRIYEKKCGEAILTEGGPRAVRQKDGSVRIHVRTPYVIEMSRRGKTVMPYLDDMAQIGGLSVRCVSAEPTTAEIRRALQDRNAMLIKGDGAICTAETIEDAEAVAAVLEKNCQAANLALKKAIPPVDAVSARLERTVYMRKYRRMYHAETADAGAEGTDH